MMISVFSMEMVDVLRSRRHRSTSIAPKLFADFSSIASRITNLDGKPAEPPQTMWRSGARVVRPRISTVAPSVIDTDVALVTIVAPVATTTSGFNVAAATVSGVVKVPGTSRSVGVTAALVATATARPSEHGATCLHSPAAGPLEEV